MMLIMDVVACLALAVFVVAWWQRRLTARGPLLLLAVVVGLIASVLGMIDDRWQLAPGVVLGLAGLVGLGISRLRGGPRPRLPWVSGVLLTLLLVFTVALVYLHPVTDLPPPTGPHPVGVRDFELSDPSRPGLLASGPEEPRALLVRVWYPAATTGGVEPRPYFTEAEADATAAGFGGLMGMPFFFKYVKHARTNAFESAPLLDGVANLPVVIYSHGYTSFAWQNAALMEELASHGYLVFSVGHTYDSAPVVFPDGRVVPTDPALIAGFQEQMNEAPDETLVRAFTAEDYGARFDAVLESRRKAVAEGQRIAAISAGIWLDDRLFVHDALEAGAVPRSVADVVAAGDFSATGQMGMSFGGSTTGGVCMVDARCVAGVNLDGGDYHTKVGSNVPVPFLMFYSDLGRIYAQLGATPPEQPEGFNDFSYERPELAGLRTDVVRLKVNGVAHLGVSDFTLFFRNPVRDAFLGSIDPEAMIRIQNDFVLGFFDTYLKGEAVGFPATPFAAHQDWVRRDDVSGVRSWWLAGHPEDETVLVVLETTLGEVEIALYPKRAPVSVANFLRYIDGGHYQGAAFYRAARQTGPGTIGVLQGGLLATAMTGDGAEYANPGRVFPPIAHEPTTLTGIANERGTLAWARLEPGTAGSEFFFNLADNPVLNSGVQTPGRDGAGYATFGRVIRGLSVLDEIHAGPADGATGIERLQGQILTRPVEIRRAYRREASEAKALGVPAS